MIAAWQKKAGAPPTGFFTAAQRDQLLRAAAPAVARWDEEQKKIEDEKKKPDATQAAATLNQSGTGASAPPASGPSGPSVAGAGSAKAAALRDGTYRGGLGIYARALSLELRMSNGSGTGTVTSSTCGTGPMSLTVDASGNVTGEMKVTLSHTTCTWVSARITGRAEGGKLLIAVKGDEAGFASATRGEATLILSGASQTAVAESPALPSPDGRWRGTYSCTAAIGSNPSMTPPFTIGFEVLLANSSSTWKALDAGPANGNTLQINVSVDSSGVKFTRLSSGVIGTQLARPDTLAGQYDGNAIRGNGRETGPGARDCVLALKRA